MMSTSVAAPPASYGPADLIGQPPATVGAWVALFDVMRLPVLRRTSVAIEELRAREDDVDAHMLAEVIGEDPLMTLKVLSLVANQRHRVEGSEPETLIAALVMLGISPFFSRFGEQPTVEALLGDQPSALDGFHSVLRRAHRAGRFALSFAVQRMDHDAATIQLAAMLHDFAELLAWLRAPALAGEVARRQRENPMLRSVDVQRQVMNIALMDLQHALMVQWRLPRILVDLADGQKERLSLQSRTVALAIRFARHSQVSWDNAAIADDVDAIAGLLNLSIGPARSLLLDIDGA